MKKDLKNKVIIISGSGSGIGKELALQFCREGAKVMLNGRRKSKLLKTQQEFLARGYSVEFCVADITVFKDCEFLVKFTQRVYGEVDIFVANGSMSANGRFEETLPDVFKTTVESNIFGVTTPLFASLASLKKSQGSFIIIGSIAGFYGMPTGSAYCLSKMALTGFQQSVSAELSVYNIHVGIVYVGFTENELDKKTYAGSGELINVPIRNKIFQQSRETVAASILKLIKKRKNKSTLSLLGKSAGVLSKFFPQLLRRISFASESKQFLNSFGDPLRDKFQS